MSRKRVVEVKNARWQWGRAGAWVDVSLLLAVGKGRVTAEIVRRNRSSSIP